jgi:ribosomal protein S18 acetylase RimI-like enzyme
MGSLYGSPPFFRRSLAASWQAPAVTDWIVEPPTQADFDRWRQLYRGYADFYDFPQTDDQASTVWTWIQDPAHEVRALVVRDRDRDGVAVGLAHFRPFARPLRGSTGCFLDDLFVDTRYRGSGAVDALLAELRRVAAAEGWDTVRWITADNNYRARTKYDQVAARTTWITYDMAPNAV